jgi:hypothetical protein
VDSERSIVLGSDEGVIAVRSDDGRGIDAAPWDGSTLVEVSAELASAGELWVKTGNQWGPFSVTTRALDAAPDQPSAEWEDVVEFSVTATGSVSVTELVNNDPTVPLIAQAGEYRVRVSARGRTMANDLDDEEAAEDDPAPLEWYLLEVWPAPSAAPQVLRLSSAFAQAELAGPPAPLEIPEAQAGLASAGRIGRDVDGKPEARKLSGTIGSVDAERTVRGTRRKLFLLCAHVTSWTHLWAPGRSWSWVGGGMGDYDLNVDKWATADDHVDQLSGSRGAIRSSFVEVDRPKRAVRRWNWVISPGHSAWVGEWHPVLPEDTLLTVTLDQSKDPSGDPWTTIRIHHEGLPVEWLDDMETWWSYQLAIADHVQLGL